MKITKVVSVIQVLIVSLFLTSLSTPADAFAQNQSDQTQTITSMLNAYEDALSSSTTPPEQTISPSVVALVKERQAYYKKYFDLGLHSELTDIESRFDQESILSKDTVKTTVTEIVNLTGIPKLQVAGDYPVYQAALLAMKQTDDKEIIIKLEKHAIELLEGVQQSIDEGKFTITIINLHTMTFDPVTGQLLMDEYTSKSVDDAGTDQAVLINGKTALIEPDMSQMPDYRIYTTPIETLAQELLETFMINTNRQKSDIFGGNNVLYSGNTAATYIRTWVSVNKINCAPNGTVYQNTNAYNSSYPSYNCNDCANYVSQALHYGGQATTSTWQSGTYAWVNVTGLGNYIVSQGLGNNTTCSSLGLGDLGIIPGTHVVMVSALNPMRFSAHTSDRLNYTWQSSLSSCINVY